MSDSKPPIIIVAGGLATRMRPITEEIPKCLVDINGKPLIQHQIEYFRAHGFTDIIFCVAHLADKVKDYFKDGTDFGVRVRYVQETKELMGTAGSVKLCEGFIDDENFMVYYGDNLTNMDFDQFIKFHKDHHAMGTVCMRPHKDGYKSSSIITLDEKNVIKIFLEKPSLEDIEKYQYVQKYINSGIYMFNKKIFDFIPQNQKYDFAKEVFPELLKINSAFYGYVTTEYFREIGRIEKYELFLKEVAGKDEIFMPNKAVFLDRDGVINYNIHGLIRPEQLQLIEGSAEAIKKLNDAKYAVIVVTNQPELSKGFLTFKDIDEIHTKMYTIVESEGGHIDALYMCPHHPHRGFPGEISELKIDCNCRKPKPGLILRAAQENNIDLSQSWMIGDSPSDLLAAQSAGVRAILVGSGSGSGRKEEIDFFHKVRDYVVKNDLLDAVKYILKEKQ